VPFNPHHAHGCDKTKRKAVLGRHNGLTAELVRIATRAGCTTRTELPYPNSAKKPDVQIIFNDADNTIIDIDTTVTHAHLPSTAAQPVTAVIAAAESRKRIKYSQLSQVNGATFYPFAWSSLGQPGPAATTVLEMLAYRAVQHGYADDFNVFYRESVQSILLSLHHGNAIVQDQVISYYLRQRSGSA